METGRVWAGELNGVGASLEGEDLVVEGMEVEGEGMEVGAP